MMQTRDLENPVELAIRELKQRLAIKPVEPFRFSEESYEISATSVDFLTSKTFKQMFLGMSDDKMTDGTIAMDQATHLCAIAWRAGREAAKQERELSARLAALCPSDAKATPPAPAVLA